MFTLARTSKTIILLFAVTVIAAITASSASALSIKVSKHNFATGGGSTGFSGNYEAPDEFGIVTGITEVCVFCHTPHNGAAGKGAPLWNRSTPTRSYTMYSSQTMSAVNPTDAQGPQGVSALCMSCHDGVTAIAVGTLLNPPGDGPVTAVPTTYQSIGELYTGSGFPSAWGPNIGNQTVSTGAIDLSDDHPISFVYPTNAPGVRPTRLNSDKLRLFGASKNMVECATCHLVHDNANEPFLAMPNADSAMCLSCHDK